MSNREQVLLLAADEIILIELQQLLEEAGFNTSTTWDYGEALRLLKEGRVDLVLVGHHPPEVDAGELLKQLQEMHSSAACFVLQGSVQFAASQLPILERHKYSEILKLANQRVATRRRATAA